MRGFCPLIYVTFYKQAFFLSYKLKVSDLTKNVRMLIKSGLKELKFNLVDYCKWENAIVTPEEYQPKRL